MNHEKELSSSQIDKVGTRRCGRSNFGSISKVDSGSWVSRIKPGQTGSKMRSFEEENCARRPFRRLRDASQHTLTQRPSEYE